MLYLLAFMVLGHGSSPSCEEIESLVAKGAGDLPGPVNLDYSFDVGGRMYRLTIDSTGLEGDFFAEAKEEKIWSLSPDDAWTQIKTSTLTGTELSSVAIPNPPGALNALFKTSTGAIIGKAVNNRLWRRDPGGVWQDSGTNCPWLGSRSVGESSGVIMIAEYCSDTSLVGRILRSRDDGLTWETVLQKRALGDSDPQIRHFHMVVNDPYTGDWYAFSGDSPVHCRVFKSQNEGDSWIDVTDVNGDELATESIVHTPSLHRATSMWFTTTGLVWGTDDRLGGTGARLVVTPRTNPLSLSVIGNLSYNHTRTAIYYPGLGHLLITENVSGYTGIELVLVTDSLEIVPIGIIPGINSYFTSSIASLTAEPVPAGWAAFSLARGVAIPHRTLRYTITREGPGPRPPGVPLLSGRGVILLVILVGLCGRQLAKS